MTDFPYPVGFRGRSKARSSAQGRRGKFLSLFCPPEARGPGDGGKVIQDRLDRIIHPQMGPIIRERKGTCVHGTNRFG